MESIFTDLESIHAELESISVKLESILMNSESIAIKLEIASDQRSGNLRLAIKNGGPQHAGRLHFWVWTVFLERG